MFITKRMLPAFLAVLLVLPLSFLGCAKEPSAEEIVANAVDASAKVATVKVDMDLAMTVEVIGGNRPVKMEMQVKAGGPVDMAKREIKMSMDANADIPGLGRQDVSMEMYVVGGWMYTKVGLPGGGGQWVKMNLTEQLWAAQDHLSQQVDFLKTAIEVTLVGSEKVDGVDCYVLQVNPDMTALTKWVLSQQQQGGVDLSKLDLARLFKTTSIKEWVAKDSYLPVRADLDVVLEMLPGDVGATAQDFEKVTMDIAGQFRYYDYGKPVTIVLPQEALGAQEIRSAQ